MRRPILLLIGLLVSFAGTVRAQPTNVEAYQQLAVACLADVPDTLQAFRLDAPERMPYVRTALANRWQEQGRTLFLPDTSARPPDPLPRLAFRIEDADVTYEREGRRLRRTVELALRYTLTAANGRLLREQSCRETFDDTIARGEREALEDAAYRETQGAVPEAGGWRRYVEPAVLAAAVGVGVYLFFSLRGDTSGDNTP